MNIINLEKKPTIVFGDFHGEIKNIVNWYFEREKIEDCNIIVAGDIGVGFSTFEKEDKLYTEMNELFIKKNIHCYFIRGNHDDPSYWNEHKIEKSNIIFVEDYTILSNGDNNILCIGGGISIDRTYRNKRYYKRLQYLVNTSTNLNEIKQKYPPYYWEDEIPIYKEEKLQEIVDNNININYIITHTSPSFAFKEKKDGLDYWLLMDYKLETDLDKEREVFTKVFDFFKTKQPNILKEWIYGHFHGHNEAVKNDVLFTALKNADYMFDVKRIF